MSLSGLGANFGQRDLKWRWEITNWRILSFKYFLGWVFAFGPWKRIVLLKGGVRRGTRLAFRSLLFTVVRSSRLCLVDFGLALRAVSGRCDSES